MIIRLRVISLRVSSFLFSSFSRMNYTNRSSFLCFILGRTGSFAAFFMLISSSMCFRRAERSFSTLCFYYSLCYVRTKYAFLFVGLFELNNALLVISYPYVRFFADQYFVRVSQLSSAPSSILLTIFPPLPQGSNSLFLFSGVSCRLVCFLLCLILKFLSFGLANPFSKNLLRGIIQSRSNAYQKSCSHLAITFLVIVRVKSRRQQSLLAWKTRMVLSPHRAYCSSSSTTIQQISILEIFQILILWSLALVRISFRSQRQSKARIQSSWLTASLLRSILGSCSYLQNRQSSKIPLGITKARQFSKHTMLQQIQPQKRVNRQLALRVLNTIIFRYFYSQTEISHSSLVYFLQAYFMLIILQRWQLMRQWRVYISSIRQKMMDPRFVPIVSNLSALQAYFLYSQLLLNFLSSVFSIISVSISGTTM